MEARIEAIIPLSWQMCLFGFDADIYHLLSTSEQKDWMPLMYTMIKNKYNNNKKNKHKKKCIILECYLNLVYFRGKKKKFNFL